MFKKIQKRIDYWSKIRKKAPKVPDITCPDIDHVLNKLENLVGKNLNKTQFKLIEKKKSGISWARRSPGKYFYVESNGNNMYTGQSLFNIPGGSCGLLRDQRRMFSSGTNQRSTVDGIIHEHGVYYKQFCRKV